MARRKRLRAEAFTGSSSPRGQDNRNKQKNSPTNDDEPIESILSEIKAVEAKIAEVEFCVEAIEYCLLNKSGAISRQASSKVPMCNGYTPEELREKEKQLREKERQLREEKLIRYKTQGKPSYLTCLERILFSSSRHVE